MMLAIAEHTYVLYYYRAARIRVGRNFESFSEHFRNFAVGIFDSFKRFFVHSRHAGGRFAQTFPVGIFAYGDQQSADMCFDCFNIHTFSYTPRISGFQIILCNCN